MGHMQGAGLARWCAAALLATAAFSARAGTAQEQAVDGAVADGVTTAIGIAAGAIELNPIGPLLGIGAKFAFMEYAKGLPEVERPAAYAAAASFWQGATVNNVCIAAAVLSGGSFTPVCVALGVAWGAKTWKDTEHERAFWDSCKVRRDAARDPGLPCVYTAQGKTPANPEQILVTVLSPLDD